MQKIVLSVGNSDVEAAAPARALAQFLGRACSAEVVLVGQEPALDARDVFDPSHAHAESDDVRNVRTRQVTYVDQLNESVRDEAADMVMSVHTGSTARRMVRRGDRARLFDAGEFAVLSVRLGAPKAEPARRPHRLVRRLRNEWWQCLAFYRERLGWAALLTTALTLSYVGGAAMFWLHAIYLGETGPAISDKAHWFVDSSLGFVGLTPALFLLMPVAARIAHAVWGPDPHGRPVRPAPFALVNGMIFALITGVGPIVHDMIASRGTWLADHVTDVVGQDQSVLARHANHVDEVTSIGLQVLFGLPVYIALTWIAVHAVRTAVRVTPS